MKIEKLVIENFKGIRALELDFAGRSATIYGTNEAGKTSVASAWTWLMADKDSHGRADFEIKPLGEDGHVAVSGVDVSVEAMIAHEETRAVLRKVYREVWTKKRGQAMRDLTGHVVDHFIDGVPTKKGEFQAVLRDIIPDEQFRILSSPLYFSSQLPWTQRREILLDVCGGDVSDEDVFAGDPQLSILPEMLLGRTPDDHRKVLAARRTETNRELERVPTRIDEVNRNRPEKPIADHDPLDAELRTISDHLASLQREYAQVEAGGGAAERRRELAEVTAEIRTAENDWAAEIAEIVLEKQVEVGRLLSAESQASREAKALRFAAAIRRESAAGMERTLATLREKYQQIREAPGAGPMACPTCQKPYLEEERQVARAAILAEINRDGKAIKTEREAALAAAKTQEEAGEQADQQAIDLADQIIVLKPEIEQIKARPAPVSGDLLNRRDELQKALSEPSADEKALARIDAEIAADTERQIALRQQLGALERYEEAGERIEELKAEERQLAAVLEDIERQLSLLDRFTRAKVAMLDERINTKFGLARFRMFEEHINGGFTPCCEVLYKGVPFNTDLNDAHRVIVGLDIIETLSCHWRVSVPIFVDEAATIVVDLPPVDAQVIKLMARAEPPELTMELLEES